MEGYGYHGDGQWFSTSSFPPSPWHNTDIRRTGWPKVFPGALGSPVTRVDKVDRHHEVQPGLLTREG